ncbi:tumor protein p63-regulated gene 1-like protein [Sycon ciliatum]|uniref:tumor protein p63-regulated gene 1-like protein n=1 Tax=Sycon ciliatum TaxID=27933 RepID=UPI0020A88C5E|eukprot:scpid75934/ scgid20120/ Tumor protein p63-regulated gene 1-like protein; Mossy fiber terminal-associated vertebrate-specific presynaptic protein
MAEAEGEAPVEVPATYISVQKLTQGFGACKTLVDSGVDGDILGMWLLTLVDHWDHDFERIVVLTSNSLLVVKYDFLKMVVSRTTRVAFYTIFRLTTGPFAYPEKSAVPQRSRRAGTGVRIFFKKEEPSMLQKFNPWTKEMPFVTFSSHIVAREASGTDMRQDDIRLQVDPFYGRLVEAVRSCRARLITDRRMAGVDNDAAAASEAAPPETLEVADEPVTLDVYLGWSAALYNTSQLGFLKNRGFINF